MRSGEGGGDAWGLQARWHHANGDLIMCKEAALKQVRAYQGSSWQRNEEKFEQFVKASIQLCKAYMDVVQLGSDGKRELSAAQMHLRNTLKLVGSSPCYELAFSTSKMDAAVSKM